MKIFQKSQTLKSHDPSQRANGMLTIAGGIVITFTREILTLITGGWADKLDESHLVWYDLMSVYHTGLRIKPGWQGCPCQPGFICFGTNLPKRYQWYAFAPAPAFHQSRTWSTGRWHKIAIDKERHQIGKIFVPGLPAGHNFIKAVWFRFIAVQNPPFVPHSAYQPVRSCIMEVNMVSCIG